MSQENVEIARAVTEAWNTRDMDALRELYDPDVMVRTAEGWPEPGPYVGVEVALREFARYLDTLDASRFESITYVDAGDRVVARLNWRGVGHGPDMNLEFTTVTTVRKGRIIFIEFFWDHAEALEAVGLSEESMSQTNVELARSSIEAYIAGDRDAYINFFADDVEGCPDVSRFPRQSRSAVARS
jgi:ketosteroid isomerase-like protein